MNKRTVWTIGHSTRTIEKFIEMLQSFQVRYVADIRRFPGSRRYPHFSKASLEFSLPRHNIAYTHLVDLGGRRTPVPGSQNTGWRVAAFKGYADYMETADFKYAVQELTLLATEHRLAYMCSEAVWWSCHRALVSDYLKFNGWNVMHIMAVDKAEEHTYTKPAVVIAGKLCYTAK